MNLSIPLDLNRLISLSRSLNLSPSLDLSISQSLSHTLSRSLCICVHIIYSLSAICAIRRRETLSLPWKSSLGALKCSRISTSAMSYPSSSSGGPISFLSIKASRLRRLPAQTGIYRISNYVNGSSEIDFVPSSSAEQPGILKVSEADRLSSLTPAD